MGFKVEEVGTENLHLRGTPQCPKFLCVGIIHIKLEGCIIQCFGKMRLWQASSNTKVLRGKSSNFTFVLGVRRPLRVFESLQVSYEQTWKSLIAATPVGLGRLISNCHRSSKKLDHNPQHSC